MNKFMFKKEDLIAKKKAEILFLAKELKIKGRSLLGKEQLINKIVKMNKII